LDTGAFSVHTARLDYRLSPQLAYSRACRKLIPRSRTTESATLCRAI